MNLYFSTFTPFLLLSWITIIPVIYLFFEKRFMLVFSAGLTTITLIPLFLKYNLNIFVPSYINQVLLIIISLFPLIFTLKLITRFSVINYHSLLLPAFIASVSIISVLTNISTTEIIFISHLLMSIYNIIICSIITVQIVKLVIRISLVLYSLMIIVSYIYLPPTSIAISFSVLLFISFTSYLVSFIVHAQDVILQLNENNKKLTHMITRLRQSNDQCRRIILEKDMELYQLARHASLAELTTGIAHELAQPFTGIKGIAQNMIDDINYEDFQSDQAKRELQHISELIDKSASIIDHIRNFSRKNVSTMKYLNLNGVILDAIDLVNVQLKKKDIEIVFVLDDNIPVIYGDKISLEQLMLNIIINARDAILEKRYKKRSECGIVRISTVLDIDKVKVIIEDDGIGIPEEIIEKIWSPFFTTKKRDQGTGVGLSISFKIIREHKGKVYVSSNENGTFFTLQFPVADQG